MVRESPQTNKKGERKNMSVEKEVAMVLIAKYEEDIKKMEEDIKATKKGIRRLKACVKE